MWEDIISEITYTAILHNPATTHQISEAESRLMQVLPADLKELLTQTDGVGDSYGAELVWNTAKITKENLAFRTNETFRELYMPFDHLILFGDSGSGDLFAYPDLPGGEIFVWDHENDSRTWVAPSLKRYIELALRSEGEDWYR